MLDCLEIVKRFDAVFFSLLQKNTWHMLNLLCGLDWMLSFERTSHWHVSLTYERNELTYVTNMSRNELQDVFRTKPNIYERKFCGNI